MSGPQPFTIAYQPGRPVVIKVTDASTGYWWNTSSEAWESYTVANELDYRISLTDANSIGWYTVALPSAMAGMTVQAIAYDTDNMTVPIGATEMSPPDTSSSLTTPTSPAIVEIVNMALMNLGVSMITSLEEDSEMANRARQIWARTRDSLLREHYWKFATFIESLALLADETTPGWAYLYAYPAQCLMIRRLFDGANVDPGIFSVGVSGTGYNYDSFQNYGQYDRVMSLYKQVISPDSFTKAIASNLSEAYVEYTYRVVDPAMWDQKFTDAMQWSLTAQLGHTLTGKTELAEKADAKLAKILTEAKRLDAQEDEPMTESASTYQRSRA